MKIVFKNRKKLFIDPKDGTVKKVQTINEAQPRTDQTQKDQCDINNIMKKYGNKMQNVPPLQRGVSGDFSNLPSYMEALNTIHNATESFLALPANVRKRFSNDPHEMIEFLRDPENTNEAIRLGLAKKPEQQNDTVNAKTKNAKTKNEPVQTNLPSDAE